MIPQTLHCFWLNFFFKKERKVGESSCPLALLLSSCLEVSATSIWGPWGDKHEDKGQHAEDGIAERWWNWVLIENYCGSPGLYNLSLLVMWDIWASIYQCWASIYQYMIYIYISIYEPQYIRYNKSMFIVFPQANASLKFVSNIVIA